MDWTDEKISQFASIINTLASISEPPEYLNISGVVRAARRREEFFASLRLKQPSFRDWLKSSATGFVFYNA